MTGTKSTSINSQPQKKNLAAEIATESNEQLADMFNGLCSRVKPTDKTDKRRYLPESGSQLHFFYLLLEIGKRYCAAKKLAADASDEHAALSIVSISAEIDTTAFKLAQKEIDKAKADSLARLAAVKKEHNGLKSLRIDIIAVLAEMLEQNLLAFNYIENSCKNITENDLVVYKDEYLLPAIETYINNAHDGGKAIISRVITRTCEQSILFENALSYLKDILDSFEKCQISATALIGELLLNENFRQPFESTFYPSLQSNTDTKYSTVKNVFEAAYASLASSSSSNSSVQAVDAQKSFETQIENLLTALQNVDTSNIARESAPSALFTELDKVINALPEIPFDETQKNAINAALQKASADIYPTLISKISEHLRHLCFKISQKGLHDDFTNNKSTDIYFELANQLYRCTSDDETKRLLQTIHHLNEKKYPIQIEGCNVPTYHNLVTSSSEACRKSSNEILKPYTVIVDPDTVIVDPDRVIKGIKSKYAKLKADPLHINLLKKIEKESSLNEFIASDSIKNTTLSMIDTKYQSRKQDINKLILTVDDINITQQEAALLRGIDTKIANQCTNIENAKLSLQEANKSLALFETSLNSLNSLTVRKESYTTALNNILDETQKLTNAITLAEKALKKLKQFKETIIPLPQTGKELRSRITNTIDTEINTLYAKNKKTYLAHRERTRTELTELLQNKQIELVLDPDILENKDAQYLDPSINEDQTLLTNIEKEKESIKGFLLSYTENIEDIRKIQQQILDLNKEILDVDKLTLEQLEQRLAPIAPVVSEESIKSISSFLTTTAVDNAIKSSENLTKFKTNTATIRQNKLTALQTEQTNLLLQANNPSQESQDNQNKTYTTLKACKEKIENNYSFSLPYADSKGHRVHESKFTASQAIGEHIAAIELSNIADTTTAKQSVSKLKKYQKTYDTLQKELKGLQRAYDAAIENIKNAPDILKQASPLNAAQFQDVYGRKPKGGDDYRVMGDPDISKLSKAIAEFKDTQKAPAEIQAEIDGLMPRITELEDKVTAKLKRCDKLSQQKTKSLLGNIVIGAGVIIGGGLTLAAIGVGALVLGAPAVILAGVIGVTGLAFGSIATAVVQHIREKQHNKKIADTIKNIENRPSANKSKSAASSRTASHRSPAAPGLARPPSNKQAKPANRANSRCSSASSSYSGSNQVNSEENSWTITPCSSSSSEISKKNPAFFAPVFTLGPKEEAQIATWKNEIKILASTLWSSNGNNPPKVFFELWEKKLIEENEKLTELTTKWKQSKNAQDYYLGVKNLRDNLNQNCVDRFPDLDMKGLLAPAFVPIPLTPAEIAIESTLRNMDSYSNQHNAALVAISRSSASSTPRR